MKTENILALLLVIICIGCCIYCLISGGGIFSPITNMFSGVFGGIGKVFSGDILGGGGDLLSNSVGGQIVGKIF